MVKKKINLVDTLLDVEIANSLIQEAKDEAVMFFFGIDTEILQEGEDLVITNYKKLKAEIKPLDKNSETYKLLESYAYNTHGIVWNQIFLKLLQIRITLVPLVSRSKISSKSREKVNPSDSNLGRKRTTRCFCGTDLDLPIGYNIDFIDSKLAPGWNYFTRSSNCTS